MQCSSPRIICYLAAAVMLSAEVAAYSSVVPGLVQDCPAAASLVAKARAMRDDAAGLAERVRLYRQATEVCPAEAEAWNGLGDTLERLQRFDEAIAAYRRAVEVKPEWALPYFGIGDTYRTLGRADDALYWYTRALAVDPSDTETKAWVDAQRGTTGEPLLTSDAILTVLDGSRGMGVLSFDERRIPFNYDQATLRPDARNQIREIAFALWDLLGATRGPGVLASGPVIMEVAGHADARGTSEYNRSLAMRRAQAVVDELVAGFRIPRERLRALSFGESRPVCREDTEECHARNRRVEIRRPRNHE